MVKDIDKYFKHITECNKEAIDYITSRSNGDIVSIKTPWEKLNKALAGGIEWGSITIIGGRPSSGKTLLSTLITRNAFDLNPREKFLSLEFQFEMLGRNSSLRMAAAELGLSMADLKSAESPLAQSMIDKAQEFFRNYVDYPIYEVDEPMTVSNIEKMILRKYEIRKIPMIVSIDHSILVMKSASERDQIQTLYALGAMLTRLKKKIPVAFLIISQLNRDIDTKDRLIPFSAANYPSSSDLFGGDALFQHADNVMILDRPHKRNLTNYGPHRWLIDDPKYIALHLIKGRDNGEAFMWMDAKFENMRIEELDKAFYPAQKK